MRVGVLGPLQVEATGGGRVDIGGPRLRALLVRLALDAGRVVTSASLVTALWADDAPADAVNALQTLVSRLRRALPPELVVRSASGGYLLDVAPDAVDAVRFERLVSEGRRALRDGEAGVALIGLRAALALWRGEALADAAEAPFAEAVIVRLHELRVAATEDRLEAELQVAPDRSHLVAELEELTTRHPLRERMRSLLVRALGVDGRRAEALAAYEEFRRQLAEELGTDPGPELQRLHLALLRGERLHSPVSRRRARGNLRVALTSFVGRDQERELIEARFREGRLVTLIGPGGAGKTRLAGAVAADLAGEVPGGTWLVELAAVTDREAVAEAVIGALAVREAGLLDLSTTARDPLSRLVDVLSAGPTLVVLDGCEHVVDATARLADELLGRCPDLRILATSREPLGILGESLCPVGPLAMPEAGAPPAAALASPAGRLFVDRATAVTPGFAITEDNVSAVVEICRRLDGLPLAIELAAARLRTLSVEQVAARLDDRFRLLTGGSRTALPRHRTLRAVVDWSWSLLDADERRLAERLAVFSGRFSPEAAAWVAAPAPADVDALGALVDRSLLHVVEGREPRYRMLETIREYGLERLAADGKVADVRARHAAHFLQLAEAAEPHLRGPDQVRWIQRLAAERDDLLAALHFARDTADAATATRLAAALGLLWTIGGNHAEAAARLRLALDVPGEPPPAVRAAAAALYLLNAVLAGGHASALAVAEDLQTSPAGADEAGGHPASALAGPAAALVADDRAAGLAAIDRRLDHPAPWTRAMLLLLRALLQGNAGDLPAMCHDLDGAVREFRRSGERWGLATCLAYLGVARVILGGFDDAIVALEESVRLQRELDPADEAVMQRVWIAEARRQKGDVDRARRELLELVTAVGGPSPRRHAVLARITLGNVARQDGDLDEAARAYAAARGDLDLMSLPDSVFGAMLETGMGHLAMAGDDLEAAGLHLEAGLTLALQAPDMPLVALVSVGVARLALQRGSPGEAAGVLGAAHALRGAPDAFNPDVARLAEELRCGLGERAYEAAYAAGRDLDRAGALAQIEAQVRRR